MVQKKFLASFPVFKRHIIAGKLHGCIFPRDGEITACWFVAKGTPFRALRGGVVTRCIKRVFKKDGRRQHQITVKRSREGPRGAVVESFEVYTGIDFRTYRVKKDRYIRAGKILGHAAEGGEVCVALFGTRPTDIKFRKHRTRKRH